MIFPAVRPGTHSLLRSIVVLVKGLTGLLYFVIRGVSILSICSTLIKTEAVCCSKTSYLFTRGHHRFAQEVQN